jgi:MYXO-CTERM domain-containing protein
MQLAMVPFTLVQDPATGAVSAQADLTTAKYVTNNIGNEYRNANYPEAFAIDGGAAICAAYNYQAEGTNDTKRYVKCFNQTGAVVMPQTLAIAKNNDDCSMRQDGEGFVRIASTAGKEHFAVYAGCNGNGRDDGWYFDININKQADGTFKLVKNFDVSVEPQEERSRGKCTPSAADTNTVYCTWTAGNNQPQRNGTWLGAIDVTPGKFSGANQQNALLWKMQIGGRKQIEGRTTYSMRAMHDRILVKNATTGALEASDMIIWRSGDLQGNNNTNGKGGTYRANQMAVMKLSRDGMTYVTPLVDMGPKLLGLDGTHLAPMGTVLGTEDALKFGLLFNAGSHTGGGYSSQVRAVSWDAATGFADAGSYGIAPHDRHLYPNYTGNNPGNQGRNHASGTLIKNPFLTAGSTTKDAYLTVWATSGKDQADMTDPRKKLSAYISVLPVAQVAATPAPSQPEPDPSLPEPTPTPEPTPEEETVEAGSDTTLGGCSTGGSSTGFATLLLLGLATLIRRRR